MSAFATPEAAHKLVGRKVNNLYDRFKTNLTYYLDNMPEDDEVGSKYAKKNALAVVNQFKKDLVALQKGMQGNYQFLEIQRLETVIIACQGPSYRWIDLFKRDDYIKNLKNTDKKIAQAIKKNFSDIT